MATIGPFFSAAIIRSKHLQTSDAVFRLAVLKTHSSSNSNSVNLAYGLACSSHLDSLSISSSCVGATKWRVSSGSASVAHEEAVAADAAVDVEGTDKEDTNYEENESVQEEMMEEEVVVNADAPLNTKLYFGNLPYNCDSAQLAGIIQDYGSPEMVEVLYDKNTGRSRGFAFVTMSSIEDCNVVIENLDGSLYGGRTLRVNFSNKPKPKEPLYPETEYKLFVGNLSWSVTSEALTEAFEECGNVVGARVLYDGDTGKSRGYGFVCYSTQQEMEDALKHLNGAELEGRAMRVNVALGKRS